MPDACYVGLYLTQCDREKGVPPPGAAVAYRRILKDPRDEPQYAERVPYIVSNADGRRLIDRARMPEEMLSNRSVPFPDPVIFPHTVCPETRRDARLRLSIVLVECS